jgi:thiol:disulfide interchange protein
MRVKTLFALAFVLLLLALAPLFRAPQKPIAWRTSPERAFSEAAEEDLPVLVFLYTDWCTYCRQMDQTTFSDPEVVNRMSTDYVWLRLNAETDPYGVRMQQRFLISGFPTLLILDSSGREIDRLQGYIPPQHFPEAVRSSLSS